MTDYASLLMSLTSGSALDSGCMEQLIQEGLYVTPALFSVDRAALWVLDKDEQAYLCEADFFDGMIDHRSSQRLTKKKDAELFSFLESTSEIIISPMNHLV